MKNKQVNLLPIRIILAVGGVVLIVDVLSRWVTLNAGLVSINTSLSAFVYPIIAILLIGWAISMKRITPTANEQEIDTEEIAQQESTSRHASLWNKVKISILLGWIIFFVFIVIYQCVIKV